jgi:lipoyl(octanoyl) transferase
MACDEALLRSALHCGVASLRFYTWSEPTLSLGYFQAHQERLADPLLAKVAWVRRPTGGAAILHDRELTYALALPAGAPWHTEESWLCRFHHAVAATLKGFGVESRAVLCGEDKKLGPFLCFLHHTPGDLVIAGHKVVGSAQRRPHGATMQHGSILIHRSPHTPSLPGIADISGANLAASDMERAISAELQKHTGWSFEPDDWTAAERSAAAHLEREKYATDAWNEKR